MCCICIPTINSLFIVYFFVFILIQCYHETCLYVCILCFKALGCLVVSNAVAALVLPTIIRH